jgi:hypothetical protein
MVLCNATAGQDDAFVRWMREEHVAAMLDVTGIVRVVVERARDATAATAHRFVVRYELSGVPAEEVLAEIDRRLADGRVPLHPSFDPTSRVRGLYDAVLDAGRQ